MELIERTKFLTSLKTRFKNVAQAEGHSVFISGEAGIGKTSLVRAFCRQVQDDCEIYQGTCDAMFSPRPLAPIFDIIWQIRRGMGEHGDSISNRTALFARFFYELENKKQTTVIVIEDIHWADEATLDFIKFLGRRINRLHCLFILTYRNDEIHSHHPLKTLLGQLAADSFSRFQLTPLSSQAVEGMAAAKGYKGEDVYAISGGNPFYVNEILASYSAGVPENVRDSVLSVYDRQPEKTKQLWQMLSPHPAGFEIKYLGEIDPAYADSIHDGLDLKILILQDGLVSFKHELYRRTIENSLSEGARIALNKKILDSFLKTFEQNGEIERIIHHAKNANEYELVIKYAPLAAKHASSVGAHMEASKLYLTAIEYYRENNEDVLTRFYEGYAYECYLTNQVKEAIVYAGKSLHIWKEKNNAEKAGDCMRFLSRLWWFEGNTEKAEAYARQAIDTLPDQHYSRARAMALSNMSQLKMLSDESEECIGCGEKAIALARELGDAEILCHALNNVGTVYARIQPSRRKGNEFLQKSLDIALRNSYQEHVARAYTNLGSSAVVMKDFVFAKQILEKGIQYCEERDLDSWSAFLHAEIARLNMEKGYWKEALEIAENLLNNKGQMRLAKIEALVVIARIKMRQGERDVLPLLNEAKTIAFEAMELQSIIPALAASLEYEWITGKYFIEDKDLDHVIEMIGSKGNIYENGELAFWLFKARKRIVALRESCPGYQIVKESSAVKAAAVWKQLGCPYEQALALFEGNESNKRMAITIVRKLGADAVYDKMKFLMRALGIRNIPRGIRQTTRSNPAYLTTRELDVLQLLKEGLQNKEIGERLFISAKTVDHHLSSIFLKLGVNSRARAVNQAIEMDVIK